MNDFSELEDRSYEELVEALEAVLSELENGGLPLDQAVDAYERGVRLSEQAERLLTEAELRIEQLRERPTT
ncbi:MAG: exodeoxyribonuclease VII small subunit [Chloroflexi bacterium]|nr:exodeoxyribonuclease VII small subunit [Chloroflexota bacterium]MCY3697747.1 exodeoxyribonuclease VII small subunit [Chloroflexota bacterium]MXX32904.1 exodeoxyribonuclease VII small subunit [Chloroflexota bacterium]MXX81736.1 exodeoxyribonuclease VII small subunit [Chloroflexota bacterium]MYB21938.1 exodeoxyribonuclease VII small subunit [Chloroflexota bacterium]